MAIIKNNNTLSAEELYDILKKDFAEFVNTRLGSNLTVDYAHVYDVINVLFPEVIEDTAFTIIVTDEELSVSNNTKESAYNTELLEENLVEFLNQRAG